MVQWVNTTAFSPKASRRQISRLRDGPGGCYLPSWQRTNANQGSATLALAPSHAPPPRSPPPPLRLVAVAVPPPSAAVQPPHHPDPPPPHLQTPFLCRAQASPSLEGEGQRPLPPTPLAVGMCLVEIQLGRRCSPGRQFAAAATVWRPGAQGAGGEGGGGDAGSRSMKSGGAATAVLLEPVLLLKGRAQCAQP
jgi:hypothetical protein